MKKCKSISELAKVASLVHDHGDDGRLFANKEHEIKVFANLMTKSEYREMEKAMRDSKIVGHGYSIGAWNDVSGYQFWKECGENGEYNYIQITVYIEDLELINPAKLKLDVQKMYDKLSYFDNSHEALSVMKTS